VAIWCGGLASGVDAIGEMLGRQATADDLEPLTWAMYQLGTRVTASDYLKAVSKMHVFARFFARHVDAFDVTLSPTLNTPPVPLGTIDVRSGNVDAAL
jgi:amidase